MKVAEPAAVTEENPTEVVDKNIPLVEEYQEMSLNNDKDEDIDDKEDLKESDEEKDTVENSTEELPAVKAAELAAEDGGKDNKENLTEENLPAAIDETINQAIAALQSITDPKEKPSVNGNTDDKRPKKIRRLKNSLLKKKEALLKAVKMRKYMGNKF